MSHVTDGVGAGTALRQHGARSSGPLWSVWWRVFMRELADLWIGGKALYLILAYSIFLGFQVLQLSSDEPIKPDSAEGDGLCDAASRLTTSLDSSA